MQKLINVLALTSFALNAAVVGVGFYAYSQREKLAESVRETVMSEVTKAIPTLVNGAVGEAVKNIKIPNVPTEPVKQPQIAIPPLV